MAPDAGEDKHHPCMKFYITKWNKENAKLLNVNLLSSNKAIPNLSLPNFLLSNLTNANLLFH